MNEDMRKRRNELRRKIEDKIDQYNKSTFPASDAPSWDSLQGLERELESLSTNRNGQKEDSADQQS